MQQHLAPTDLIKHWHLPMSRPSNPPPPSLHPPWIALLAAPLISNSGFEVRQRPRRRRRGRPAATCGQKRPADRVKGRHRPRRKASQDVTRRREKLSRIGICKHRRRPAWERRGWIGWKGLLEQRWGPITAQLTTEVGIIWAERERQLVVGESQGPKMGGKAKECKKAGETLGDEGQLSWLVKGKEISCSVRGKRNWIVEVWETTCEGNWRHWRKMWGM